MNGRGGSRIPRRKGRQSCRRDVPTYKFARFSEKLHEIKKNLVRWGGGGTPRAHPPWTHHWMANLEVNIDCIKVQLLTSKGSCEYNNQSIGRTGISVICHADKWLCMIKNLVTRMHSSRMHTAHLSGHLGGRGDVYRGGVYLSDVWLGGVYLGGGGVFPGPGGCLAMVHVKINHKKDCRQRLNIQKQKSTVQSII